MICKYAKNFCWKNVSSFCSAKATHIFSAKNIKILCIEAAKTVNETTLWTTGPWMSSAAFVIGTLKFNTWAAYVQQKWSEIQILPAFYFKGTFGNIFGNCILLKINLKKCSFAETYSMNIIFSQWHSEESTNLLSNKCCMKIYEGPAKSFVTGFGLLQCWGGRVVRRCCVSCITGASIWYWLTVGQGLLSL